MATFLVFLDVLFSNRMFKTILTYFQFDISNFYDLQDPVTREDNWFYPFKRQLVKFFLSASALIFMVDFHYVYRTKKIFCTPKHCYVNK